MIKYKPLKKFMKIAIREARECIKEGNYAYGAVVVKDNKIVGKGRQKSHSDKDASSHAEIVAMRNASKNLGMMYLEDCILYTTNEPCCMCAGMIIWSRIRGVVYGADILDLLQYWKKVGNKQKLMSCNEVFRTYGSDCFVVKHFMRKECKNLFILNSKIK